MFYVFVYLFYSSKTGSHCAVALAVLEPLCRSGWLQTDRALPASASSRVLGLKACTTVLNLRFLLKSILFFVYGSFVCIYVCVTHVWCPGRPEEVLDPLDLELETVVSCHVGAGSGMKVLPPPCGLGIELVVGLGSKSLFWLSRVTT